MKIFVFKKMATPRKKVSSHQQGESRVASQEKFKYGTQKAKEARKVTFLSCQEI